MVLANVPSFRFSFRGTSAETTLLETTLLRTPEKYYGFGGRSIFSTEGSFWEVSGTERPRSLRKILRSLEHPAGQTVVYRPVSQGFPVLNYHTFFKLSAYKMGVSMRFFKLQFLNLFKLPFLILGEKSELK